MKPPSCLSPRSQTEVMRTGDSSDGSRDDRKSTLRTIGSGELRPLRSPTRAASLDGLQPGMSELCDQCCRGPARSRRLTASALSRKSISLPFFGAICPVFNKVRYEQMRCRVVEMVAPAPFVIASRGRASVPVAPDDLLGRTPTRPVCSASCTSSGSSRRTCSSLWCMRRCCQCCSACESGCGRPARQQAARANPQHSQPKPESRTPQPSATLRVP